MILSKTGFGGGVVGGGKRLAQRGKVKVLIEVLCWGLFLFAPSSTIMQPVMACGGFFCQPQQPVLQAGESIAFGVKQISNSNGNPPVLDITMAVKINYEGPAEAFGWLLPVPTQPDVSVGSDLLFEGLFDATRPTYEFTIDNSRSTTCNPDVLDIQCATSPTGPGGGGVGSGALEDADGGDAIVLEQGTVGPFDFVTIEPANNRPESIFEWLQENGYDQPENSEVHITNYASMGMKFVALRLTKDSDAGDIRPIVLQYQMIVPPPSSSSSNNDSDNNTGGIGIGRSLLESMPVACVPIELTSIAATPAMPIQIYMLSSVRAFPLNYFHVTLDETQIDWLGCNNNALFSGEGRQNCYLNDQRQRLERALSVVEGHGFITEYAGSTMIVSTSVGVEITNIEELAQQTSPKEFLLYLATYNIPAIPLVHTIIERYIPNSFQITTSGVSTTPFQCQSLPNVYLPDTPWVMNDCLDYVDLSTNDMNGIFDPSTLATKLNDEIFIPSIQAQSWVNEYPYLTRLYGQLDPEEMTKDPFFSFNSELEDVSRYHRATGVPVCDSNGVPNALDIYLGIESSSSSSSGGGEVEEEEPYRVEAFLGCRQWIQNVPPSTAAGGTSSASKVEALGYFGEPSWVVSRDESSGLFSVKAIEELVLFLDSRVMAANQTTPINPDWNSSDIKNETNTDDPSDGASYQYGLDSMSSIFLGMSLISFIVFNALL